MTKFNLTRLIASVLAVVTTTSLALPTLAHAEIVSTSVSANGLNLTTADGQHQLDRRIARAARSVCGMDDTRTESRMPSVDSRACYDRAVHDARTRLADTAANRPVGG